VPKVSFQSLWDNHPFPESPCDTKTFLNQCAIRMGVALEKAHVDTTSFDIMYPRRRCYPGFKHSPRHILAAQELANWLETQTSVVGTPEKRKKVTSGDYGGRKGIVFVRNGWGPTDHIDVWNGIAMKGGDAAYFSLGQEIWFWELT
jgi:hypothetical protein